LSDSGHVDCARAAKIAVYAIKGVELFDPHVGGKTSVKVLKTKSNKLQIADIPCPRELERAKEKMEDILKRMGSQIGNLVAPPRRGKHGA
jgi:hypothetical protein